MGRVLTTVFSLALQCELLDVLIRFREQDVAVTADIEAMFSRITMKEEDARYHRFLWRDSQDQPPQTFQMTGVVFGDSPSPCLAISTLHRAVDDSQCSDEIKQTIKTQFYVDDYLDSFADETHAIEVASKVKHVLLDGNFNLRGWTSNSTVVLRAVDGVTTENVPLHQDDTKVLGSVWNPVQDCITFQVEKGTAPTFTRRGLLSKLAGLFDPQGLISPVTVSGKIKMKELVVQNLDWDDPVPEESREWWSGWINSLQELYQIKFPRCLLPLGVDDVHKGLHFFCDASEQAFGAVAYLRSQDCRGNVVVRLICSKTRVSSKKPKTIPKLELQGAVLATRLAKYLTQTLRFKIDSTFYWTDSQVVQAWIHNCAQTFKPFVAVRVGEIQTMTKAQEWRHVPGMLNPADLATRASKTVDLPELWLSGPSFLLHGLESWPENAKVAKTTEEMRAKFIQVHVSQSQLVENQTKTLQEALENWRAKHSDGTLTKLIVQAQMEMFPEERKLLREGKKLQRASRLLELSPFVDPEGLLRARGRLSHAQIGYDQKFPIILDSKHLLTKLIVKESHQRHHHPGVNHGLGLLRQEYWVLRGREAVKLARRECEHCQKMNARPATQEMAALPEERLASGRPPFFYTSVDFFGPMEVLVSRNKIEKRWGSIFTCMTIRAVHIEVAPSLSTPDFLNVLRNFISLRGKPHLIYSDNGTNFVGAANLLAELERRSGPGYAFLNSNKITWKFQPPGAPHWGGVHEALVKSAKTAMMNVLDEEQTVRRHLRESELRTVLCEVTGFLNSRPLTYESSDPGDCRALTPNHFLLLRSNATVPPGDYPRLDPRDHFRYVQSVIDKVWERWTIQYLPNLLARKKWATLKNNLKVGDSVLLVGSPEPRSRWKLGVVEATHPGLDGLVRAVSVKTDTGITTRPITKVCPLNREEGPLHALMVQMNERGEDGDTKSKIQKW